MATSPLVIANRYRLTERLGAGAMGEVWKALDIKFQSRYVAIKLLKEDDFHHEDARNRDRLIELVRVATESGGMSEAQAVDALHDLLKNVGSTDSLRLRVASHVDARGRVPGDAVLQLFHELIGNPSFSENAKARARMRRLFHDEANSVANLRHDNIVSISDYGEHDGQPFLAMDYIEGQTLATVIQRGRGGPLPRQLEWMEDLCAGLAYAHARHLVHRDIKPANLIVEAGTESLKILDFGVVRRLQNVSETTVGVTVGTLCYMSPEQLVGSASLDHRSDIFSVGAVLYELLTGKKAFPPGESILDLLNRIQFEDPRPARDYAPALPPALDDILTQALAKDRASRYQDLLAMRRDLARVRKRLEIESELKERTHTLPRPDAHERTDPDRPAVESAGSAPSVAAPAPTAGSASEPRAPVEAPSLASDSRTIAQHIALQTRQLLSDAIAALERHDFAVARAAVDEALTLDASHEVARTLRVRIDVEWAQARALEDARRKEQEDAAAKARERERAAAEALAAQAREAEARAAQQRRDAEALAAAQAAEARIREAAAREAAAREAAAREAAAREAAAREEAAREVAAREAAAREAQAREAKAREAAARESEAREAAAREAAAHEEAARQAEARAVAVREAAAREVLARAAQPEAAAELTIEARAEPIVERTSETAHADPSLAYEKTRRFDPHDLRKRAADEAEQRTSTGPGTRRWRLAIMASAAVLVAAVAIAIYTLNRPQVASPPISEGNTKAPPVPLAVTIDIQPWARVRILDSTGADVLPAPLATPLSVSLPPGKYTLDCENGGLTARASFALEVGSDRPTLVRLVMPGFDADAALRNLLGPPR